MKKPPHKAIMTWHDELGRPSCCMCPYLKPSQTIDAIKHFVCTAGRGPRVTVGRDFRKPKDTWPRRECVNAPIR